MTKQLLKLIVLAGFSTAALAQGLPPFEEVDANKDGRISQDEAATIEGLEFGTADTNQDGVLSMEEYAAAQAE